MTVAENGSEYLSFRAFEGLKDSLLYGLNPQDFSHITEELIRATLYLKAAGYRMSENQEIIEIPKQWIWPEAHHFLEAIFEAKEKNLIYEWAHIMKSKSSCLPVNILSSLLEWVAKDLELAHFIIPVLGNAGRVLVETIKEWHLFSENAWKHPLQNEKSDWKIFAFKQLRNYNSEQAFIYFLENHPQLKEAEKLKWIRILKNKLTTSENNQLIEVLDSSKATLQIELVYISLSNLECDYFKECNLRFIESLNKATLDDFQFIALGKKEYNWSNTQKIRSIPTAFLKEEELALKYIHWIEELGEEESLLESIRTNTSALFLKCYFKHLLHKNKLTEEYPTALLSIGFDHTRFNQACIEWIEYSGDQLDLEAFLHFINLEKHFWSDEFLAKILELRTNKVLDRKYDFTIFWQLLPYKINPNSIHIKSIPAECRLYTDSLINFDTIIQFRSMIRK